MKTGFLITARLKSTRLPKKLLKEVHGEPIMVWMLRRLKLATELDEIAICTSTNSQDDPLAKIAEREGVKCFRGSEEDVIQRLYDAAQEYNLDYVINMTADCPLLPFDLVGKMIDQYNQNNADLITCHHLPVGIYLSGLKPASMKRILDMKASGFTEYWLYYYLKTDFFEVEKLITNNNLLRNGYRIALDYPEDWEMLEAMYLGMGEDTYKKTSLELLTWLDKHPEIVAINEGCDAKGAERTKADKTAVVKLNDGTEIT